MNHEREIMIDKITISPEKALESPLVNKAELARQMFPNNKNAKAYLSDKLAGRQQKRITKKDLEKIEKIIIKNLTLID